MKLRKLSVNLRRSISYLWHLPCVQFFIPSKLYIKLEYKKNIGKRLDLTNPQSFNEKLQWMKLNLKDPRYTKLVDKYEVRKYVERIMGKKYLIPLIGVYDSFEAINFDKLPKEFVLKPNHTSGDIFICRDKSQIDYVELKKQVKQWLKRRYYWLHREWPYKNITPRILCEKYMVEESKEELKDYKFLCFHGEVKCLFVCLNRQSPEGLNVDFYNMAWEPMPFERHYPSSGTELAKPKNFNKMVAYAKKLSKEFPFVRVDFYESEGNLYFGELTFYPGSGYEEFTPESYDYLLGEWIKLPSFT